MESPQSPRSSPSPKQMNILSHPVVDEPSSLWDWNDFLDFSLEDQFTLPFDSHYPDPGHVPAPFPPAPPNPSASPEVVPRVRKRDPRMSCANFLAGRVPCACPEIDAKIQEEEEAEGGPGKKRARAFRVVARCQVPDCEVDISELKGYHRRHRVCLRCANATSVMLDGQSKRYCQQCGKFHILSDFDEGKRSCRRKLERHNNRRRRRPTDSKSAHDKVHQQIMLAEDVSCDDESGKDSICTTSQVAERESLLESEVHTPRHGSVNGLQSVGSSHNSQSVGSGHGSQSLQNDSVVTFAALGETQIGAEKDDNKHNYSPSYCDNKSAFSAVCPTGRISFKLYDWNPAEFPRRLRHQIFQWLANMPVELEGYIRPGCTILTLFISMPRFMWVKLHGDPYGFIRDFVLEPGSILSKRGALFIHLNNMVFHVMKDGTSVMQVKVEDRAPRLHYVHPLCFEAGKPIEFIACGSNLLQPNFQFLLSVAGRYVANDFSTSLFCGKTDEDSASGFNHQLFRIQVSRTEPNCVGPAFVEVENQFGLSNFVPILIADKDVCAEMKIIQQKFNASICSEPAQLASSSSCYNLSLRIKQFRELIMDIGWLLKEPVLDNLQCALTSYQMQRFNSLLSFLIQNDSTVILDRVLDHIKIVMANRPSIGTAHPDIQLLQKNVDCAGDILSGKLGRHGNMSVDSKSPSTRDPSHQGSSKDEMLSVVPVTYQDVEKKNKGKRDTPFVESETSSLLDGDIVRRVSLKERPRKSCNPLLPNKVLSHRSLLFIVGTAAACFGLCVAVFHRQRVDEFATTIRRYVFDNS